MKIKRSSSKKQLHKWGKLGVGLASVVVLGGVVEPVGLADFGSTKVYATGQTDPALEARKAEIKTIIQSYRDLVGQIKALNPADYTEESWNRKYEGRFYKNSIADAYNDDLTFPSVNLEGVDRHQTLKELNATYMFGYIYVEKSIPVLKQAMADLVPVSKSLEIPIDTRPVGTPVEQPVEQPLETPVAPQPASGQPTVEERFDVLQIQYREDETDEFMGDDVIKVYSSSPKKITPPAFEGYEIKEASVGENYLMYRKPISLPYEHRFAQVLTEQDLQSHSNFLGGKIKEAQDSLRNGSVYTYILNYRRTSPVQQDPQAKRVRFEIVVKPDGAPESGFLSYDSISRRFVDLHPGESYTFPVDESKFEIRPNQKLTYSYDEVEAGKDYSISVRPKAVTSQPADKPVETPAEKQVISSEVKILNLDGSTYWRGDWGDEAIVGTATVKLEVGGNLTILATVVPEGYDITDVRFNILSTGVKELPHTWAYEEYKNYTSAPMSVPEIDILVKPVSSPATPVTPPSETPAKSPAETLTNQPSTSQTTKPVSKETTPIVNEELEPSKLASLDSYKDVTEASSSVNVRVHGQDMGKVVSLSVTKENDPSVFAKLPQGLAEHQVDLYDIKTLDTRGQFVQITEEATVTLPVAAGKEIEKVIYFLASTGAVEELPFTVDKANNQVSFTVSHFSHYGIVYQASKPVGQVQPGSVSQSVQPVVAPSIQSNQTGSSSHMQTKETTIKPAPASQSQAKTLPATGEVNSVLHLTGLGLLGLAGLVVKRRQRKSF
ncbi:TPA: LPXTG cell wall anchor domain-containing protein [Streptococcus suis]|nr:LPXTG cell wall anchor domain-containing protein [Streptococcus suis]